MDKPCEWYYIATLGNVNISNESKILQDFKDTKEAALKKHAELQAELEKLQALKLKLDRNFKMVYLFVRIILVFGGATIIYLIGLYYGAKTIEDFLNFYEASIIILFGLNFIAFGTVANSKEFIKLVRTNIENFVWRKNLTLMNQIESFKKELTNVAQTINGIVTPIPASNNPNQLNEKTA